MIKGLPAPQATAAAAPAADAQAPTRWMALQLAGMLLLASTSLYFRNGAHAFDLKGYWAYALNMVFGGVPYRDFFLEYPPLALLPMLTAGVLAPNLKVFELLFTLQSAFLAVGITIVLHSIAARFSPHSSLRVCAWWMITSVLGAPVFLFRYDLFPVLLSLLALRALLFGKPGWAGLWLALGTAAKLYPAVLLPVFAGYCLAKREWRAIAVMGLAFVAIVAAAFLPFWAVAGQDFLKFLQYHMRRGLQLESLPAGWLLLRHVVTQAPLTLTHDHGAAHVRAAGAGTILKWLPALFLTTYAVCLVVVVSGFLKRARLSGYVTHSSLFAGCLALLLVFVLCNKSLSPQYVAWILPLAAMAGRRPARVAAAIVVLTLAVYPFLYDELADLRTFPILLLNMRNLGLVALLLLAIRAALEPTGDGHAASRTPGSEYGREA